MRGASVSNFPTHTVLQQTRTPPYHEHCARFILELAKGKDITINLRHIMDFGKAKFSAKILNDDSIVHGMEEFLFAAARYV